MRYILIINIPRGEHTALFVKKVMMTFLEKYAIYYANNILDIKVYIRNHIYLTPNRNEMVDDPAMPVVVQASRQ